MAIGSGGNGKDKQQDDQIKSAGEKLVAWHKAAGKDFSRLRSPDGALIIIVTGEHTACLESWYDQHTIAEKKHN